MRCCLVAAAPLLLAAALAAVETGSLPVATEPGYVAEAKPADTLRPRLVDQPVASRPTARVLGAVVPGYLSSRGLPPIEGRFTVTDSGLVFHSAGGSISRFPLVGPVRESAGRRWRASNVALAYIDQSGGRPVYVFRVDAGVFETEVPGPLLDVASHPEWLDSIGSSEWMADQPLVSSDDSAALWATTRTITAGAYADSLYSLFGRPSAAVGLVGRRGQLAGRLGEYIGSRDSLALDPGRMTGQVQLRHTLAHELGHRWQMRAPTQLATLWQGVPPIRDPRRYGFGNASEHQAEAIAFAVDFLQTTATGGESAATSLGLLDHYELLVPGTRTIVRYLALQPTYLGHPLRAELTTGHSP